MLDSKCLIETITFISNSSTSVVSLFITKVDRKVRFKFLIQNVYFKIQWKPLNVKTDIAII